MPKWFQNAPNTLKNPKKHFKHPTSCGCLFPTTKFAAKNPSLQSRLATNWNVSARNTLWQKLWNIWKRIKEPRQRLLFVRVKTEVPVEVWTAPGSVTTWTPKTWTFNPIFFWNPLGITRNRIFRMMRAVGCTRIGFLTTPKVENVGVVQGRLLIKIQCVEKNSVKKVEKNQKKK